MVQRVVYMEEQQCVRASYSCARPTAFRRDQWGDGYARGGECAREVHGILSPPPPPTDSAIVNEPRRQLDHRMARRV